ncbi:hypothetical protein CAEBREN_17293 [Caenorhabditis brenneri]|uniref:Protein kinase domain-containing protein n=1 Tax=Caenorhabditis brenneri TaxID=135651 RepID=G0PBT9_CAEBE|nr:hypothetical protein CAEBREN_17293 [Caenorhabditis brenneri]
MKQWIWQILSGLEWLNKKGVIHRDLKPNNVFFATNDDYTLGGTLKIGDFGMILRSISSNMKAGEYRQTCTRDGCYDYTAPEVLNGEPYNANADVYSLGIIAADLIHHLEVASSEKRNVTFRRGKFPDVLKKIPQSAKDFLKKATSPTKDRPLAKELIKHAFLSDCETSKEDNEIDTLHKIENGHELSETEMQIRENVWSRTSFSVKFQDGTVSRLGVSKDAVEELLKHEIPKESLFDAATRILTILISLTGSTDSSVMNTAIMPYYEEFLKDLHYYAERIKDHKLIFFGLESKSLENLKESYVNGHVKLIPNLEVWMMDGCKDFMRSVFGTDGKIQFTNGNAPLHYMPRNDDLEYISGVQTPVDVEGLDLILSSPIPAEIELLAQRVQKIGSFITKGRMPEVTWSNYNLDVIRNYYRLLLAACNFIKEKLVINILLDFSFSADIQKVIRAPDGFYDFLLPTIDLFVQEPVQSWESWTEVFSVPLCKRTYALYDGEFDPFEAKLSSKASIAASHRFLKLSDRSRVCIGSPTKALRMVGREDVNIEEKLLVVMRILTLQIVLTHSCPFKAMFVLVMARYSNYDLATLVEYLDDLFCYAEKLQDQEIVLFGLEEESFDRIKEKRHVKMIPSIEVWLMDGCKEYLKAQTESEGKIVFSNEDEKLEWIPRREGLVNLNGDFGEEHVHVDNDDMESYRRRLQIMVDAHVPETAELLVERIASISEYISGQTQCADSGQDIDTLKNYLRLLLGACRFAIDKLKEGKHPLFNFNYDMRSVATGMKTVFVQLPTFQVFLLEPMEHWESWAEVSWKLWTPEDEESEEDEEDEENDDVKKDATLDANYLSSSLAEIMKRCNAIYYLP